MPTLTTDGPIWTLDLGDDENRFSLEWLSTTAALLDEVAGSDQPAALVTTGSGKFFSNGLDLEWLGAHPDQLGSYVDRIHALFAQVLTLPVPTVAAVNGHAFGGGAMLAMAHDHRVMRSDRGFFCFPEVDIHIPFTEGMSALITAKLTPRRRGRLDDHRTTLRRRRRRARPAWSTSPPTWTRCSAPPPTSSATGPARTGRRWGRSSAPCTPTSSRRSPARRPEGPHPWVAAVSTTWTQCSTTPGPCGQTAAQAR